MLVALGYGVAVEAKVRGRPFHDEGAGCRGAPEPEIGVYGDGGVIVDLRDLRVPGVGRIVVAVPDEVPVVRGRRVIDQMKRGIRGHPFIERFEGGEVLRRDIQHEGRVVVSGRIDAPVPAARHVQAVGRREIREPSRPAPVCGVGDQRIAREGRRVPCACGQAPRTVIDAARSRPGVGPFPVVHDLREGRRGAADERVLPRTVRMNGALIVVRMELVPVGSEGEFHHRRFDGRSGGSEHPAFRRHAGHEIRPDLRPLGRPEPQSSSLGSPFRSHPRTISARSVICERMH